MRGYFITGTDTDAGKTAVTASLGKHMGSLLNDRLVLIKPVQTGCLKQTDGSWLAPDEAVYAELGCRGKAIFRYEPPCSPHLAASLAGDTLSAASLAEAVRGAVPEGDAVLVEGAGGCQVPLSDGENMMDLMLALGLPVILVTANRLGCINHALLSLEALQSRGLRCAGVILNRTRPGSDCDAGCGPWAGIGDEKRILDDNEESLRRLCAKRGVPLLASLPYTEHLDTDQKARLSYADRLTDAARYLVEHMAPEKPAPWGWAPGEDDAAMLAFDREHLWHPYTSALHPLPVHAAARTHDNRIVLTDGTELIDGMSSWWCAIHGYGNPALEDAMARQIRTLSHVMFGGLTHRPAVELGQRLLAMVPEGLKHIFYADSGSVAVEVALKMAVQYQISIGRGTRRHFLTPMGGYHGDTQGAMSVCDPVNGMHSLFTGLLPKHIFMERPTCRFDQPFDPKSLDAARRILAERKDEIAAVILEPVVQGAGGMWIYHPDYLKGLRELCDENGCLLICDEIATGFGRTGKLFACEWAGITPDIMCVGKGLTGGMMTGGAVLATARVAEGIEQAGPEEGGGVLMHGPTFMGNPLFCAAACASLDLLSASPWKERVKAIEKELKEGLEPCRSMPGVRDVRCLGAIGVVEVEKEVDMAVLQDFFIKQGVWIRPFNHNVYLMPPYITPAEDVARLCAAIRLAVEKRLA